MKHVALWCAVERARQRGSATHCLPVYEEVQGLVSPGSTSAAPLGGVSKHRRVMRLGLCRSLAHASVCAEAVWAGHSTRSEQLCEQDTCKQGQTERSPPYTISYVTPALGAQCVSLHARANKAASTSQIRNKTQVQRHTKTNEARPEGR